MAEKRLLSSMCCDVSFIYLFLCAYLQQLMRRCTSIETYRQTKPLLTKRRKAARELNPYRQKWYWLCKLDIRILLVFMKSCGWSGNSRNPNRDTLVGFWCSHTEINGWGFREKMVQGQMCAWRDSYPLLYFLWAITPIIVCKIIMTSGWQVEEI